MISLSLGPFIFTPARLIFAAAFASALALGWWCGRKRKVSVESAISSMLFGGLITARLAFVALYFEDYLQSPWRIIDIRDGGFIFTAGIAAALLIGAYQAKKSPLLRFPLSVAAAGALSVWLAGTLIFAKLAPAPPGMAALPLTTLQGEQFFYSSTGKPVVVNLWATWCPPCRREMPVFAEAQKREEGIDFIFVNQGEMAESVRTYLDQQVFALDQVYLDENSQWASKTGAAGMPTTLFFDANGVLVGSHSGEFSRESLQHAIRQHFRVRND